MRDLKEYELSELTAEIERRQLRIAAGWCEYCGRPPEMPPCRFPERHFASRPDLLELHIRTLESKTESAYDARYPPERDV